MIYSALKPPSQIPDYHIKLGHILSNSWFPAIQLFEATVGITGSVVT